jgi:hypothetical protein
MRMSKTVQICRYRKADRGRTRRCLPGELQQSRWHDGQVRVLLDGSTSKTFRRDAPDQGDFYIYLLTIGDGWSLFSPVALERP